MKKIRRLLPSLSLAAALFSLTACETVPDAAHRARVAEPGSAFAQLPPAAQQQVRERNVERGQSPEMVYMILGTPDHVETSADGGDTQWSYKKFYHEVKVMGVPLFPSRPPRSPAPKLRADRMDNRLLGASSQTRDEYARANTHGGYELPAPPRELPDGDAPALADAELEVFFQNGKVTDVKVIRDVPLPPSQPSATP
jgi:hypothetical protein